MFAIFSYVQNVRNFSTPSPLLVTYIKNGENFRPLYPRETRPYSIMMHHYTSPTTTTAAAVTIGLKRDEKFEYQIVGTQIINFKLSLFLTFGGSTLIIML